MSNLRIFNSDTLLSRFSQSSLNENAGLSSFQHSLDQSISGFSSQLTDFRTIAPMMAGSLAYGLFRSGSLTLMGSSLPAQMIAPVLSLVGEVTVFEGVGRSLRGEAPMDRSSTRLESSVEPSFMKAWFHSFVNFGLLKLGGHLGAGQNIFIQHLMQDSAMMVGNYATAVLNLSERQTGSLFEQALHAEMTNIQLGFAMSFAHRLMSGLSIFERGLNLSDFRPEERRQDSRTFSFPSFSQPVFEAAGEFVSTLHTDLSGREFLEGPQRVFMANQGSGSGRPSLCQGLSEKIGEKIDKLDPARREEVRETLSTAIEAMGGISFTRLIFIERHLEDPDSGVGVFKVLPALVREMTRQGLTGFQQETFLSNIDFYFEQEAGEAFPLLLPMLEEAGKVEANFLHQNTIYRQLFYCNTQKLRTLRALPAAIAELGRSSWSADEQVELFARLKTMYPGALGDILETLPQLVREIRESGWDRGLVLPFLEAMAKRGGNHADVSYESAAEVVRTLREGGWPSENQDLLFLAIRSGRYLFAQVLNSIHSLLNVMRECGWSIKQQEFLRELLRMAPYDIPRMSHSLLEALRKMRQSGWRPEDGHRLLSEAYSYFYVNRFDTVFVNFCDTVSLFIGMMNEAGWEGPRQAENLFSIPELHFFQRYYKFLSSLGEVLRDLGWDAEGRSKLLLRMVVGNDQTQDFINNLRLMGQAGWSVEQQSHIIEKLENHQKKHYICTVHTEPLGIIVQSMGGAGWRPVDQIAFLNKIAACHGNGLNFSMVAVSNALSVMTAREWSAEQSHSVMNRMLDKNSSLVHLGMEVWRNIVARYASPSDSLSATESYLRLLSQLTDYNRERVLELLNGAGALFSSLGSPHFPSHLEFYAQSFERWPRLGFNLLEGLLEAASKGKISHDLSVERPFLLRFIEETHGFIPSLYEAYRQTGDSLFSQLRSHAQRILTDQLSLEEARRIIAEHGEEFLLGVIQMVSPTSGASFVERSEQLGLMHAMLEAGDLREHVPEVWRNPFSLEPFTISQGFWRLREGEEADPQEAISHLLNGLRVSQEEKRVEEGELVDALRNYVASNREAASLERVQSLLYRLVGASDALREKIERLQSREYTSLLLLEQLFSDKDALPRRLADALGRLPDEVFAGRGARRGVIRNPQDLFRRVTGLWNQNRSREDRVASLQGMMATFDPQEIEGKLLTCPGMSEELQGEIRRALSQAPTLSRNEVVEEILRGPLQQIRAEKGKYQYQDLGTIRGMVRAVKGPAYVLSGLSSGVCTATDVALWKNPAFRLLAISVSDLLLHASPSADASPKQVVGYVHAFETQIDGERYLTLPGINPSAEFLGQVDPEVFYDQVMNRIIALAEVGGYDGVYIPTHPNIHSNRGDIQRAIRRRNYRRIQIPSVQWNTLPDPYPFTEVFVVWERE